MTHKPITTKFGHLVVLLGDGATPTENFTKPCGFTEKSLSLKKGTNTSNVPDCDDPDAPAWEEKDVISLSATITGQGVMANESMPAWRAFYNSTVSLNVRVQNVDALANGGGYWQGKFHLTELAISASLGDKVKANVSLENDGPVVWIDAVA